MIPQQEIAKIQWEYFELLENILAKESEALANSGKDIPEFVKELLGESARQPTIVHEGRETSILFYKMCTVAEAVDKFWAENKELTKKAVGQLSAFKLQVSSTHGLAIPKAMALYADTLVVPDIILLEKVTLEDPAFAKPSSYADLHAALMLQHLFDILAHKSLFLSGYHPPIAVIYPRSTGLDQHAESRSRTDFKEYLSMLVEKDFTSPEDACDFITRLKTYDGLNGSIKRQDMLPRTVSSQNREVSPLESFVKRVLDLRSARGIDTSNAESNLGDHVARVLLTYFRELIRTSDLCFELDANPQIHPESWKLYKWRLEFDSRNTAAAMGPQATRESLQVSSFGHENLRWLGNVPTEALVRLRQQGQFEELRSVFRVGCQDIKISSLEDFAQVSARVNENIGKALSDHQAEISDANWEKWRKLGINLAACSAFIAFGLAAPLFPPLQVASTIVGILCGGKSAKDVINDHLQGRQKIKDLHNRPIGILADIYPRQ